MNGGRRTITLTIIIEHIHFGRHLLRIPLRKVEYMVKDSVTVRGMNELDTFGELSMARLINGNL